MNTMNDVVKRAWEPGVDEDVEVNFAVWGIFRCWECNVFPLKDGSTSFSIREWETDGDDTKVRLLLGRTELTSPTATVEIARALATCALNIDPDAAREALAPPDQQRKGG